MTYRFLLVAACLCLPTWAQQSSNLDAVAGLAGVGIDVNVGADTGQFGLTQDEVRVTSELRLRTAGIAVLSSTATIYLQVSVDATTGPMGLAAFSVTVQLWQPVYLPRSQKLVSASTWQARMFGGSGRDRVKDTVESDVRRLVDLFANDFLTANPKK